MVLNSDGHWDGCDSKGDGDGDCNGDDSNGDGCDGVLSDDTNGHGFKVLVMTEMGGNCWFLPCPSSERSTGDEHPASCVSSKPGGCFLKYPQQYQNKLKHTIHFSYQGPGCFLNNPPNQTKPNPVKYRKSGSHRVEGRIEDS